MVLVELTVKSSLVLAAALVAVAVMRHRSAATRHIVLASAFVTTLALPAIVVVGPHWRVPSISRFTRTSAQSLFVSVDGERRLTDSRGLRLHTLQDRLPTSNLRSRWRADDWVRLLTIVWLVGVAIHAIRLCAGIAAAVRLARDAELLTDSDWNDSLRSIANSMTLAHGVALRKSAHATVPLAWRLGRTGTLILPLAADRWEPDTRRAVLLHECGHLDRHDCAIRSIATLTCGLWWFNPLAYLALRRLRSEQERACDDVVLAAGMEPVDYARQLFEMARRSVAAHSRPTATVAMVRRSELEDRMFAIVDRSRQRGPLSPRTGLVTTAVVVALVAALGTLRLSAARTQSSMPGVISLHAAGPGGPAFEWRREVDEETRQRVASALDAATNRDSDEEVRAVANRALQTIRAMPEGTVVVSSPCRGTCLLGNGELPAPAAVLFEIQTKMALLELSSRVDTTRREAVTRLPPRYGTAIEVLADLLRDPDPQVRRLAAIRLDSVTFPPAVPGWVALLVDEDDSLRERAAISLGAIGDPAAIDSLTSVLLNDPNSDVRRQAARSLGLIAAGG
jgi:beta-lactamase regulating signal transducer with metallopeptidase domain